MANYVTNCDGCPYYVAGAQLCNNPDGPYGKDCDYSEEEDLR